VSYPGTDDLPHIIDPVDGGECSPWVCDAGKHAAAQQKSLRKSSARIIANDVSRSVNAHHLCEIRRWIVNLRIGSLGGRERRGGKQKHSE